MTKPAANNSLPHNYDDICPGLWYFFGPKLCKFYKWCNNSFFLFIYIDTKLLEKSDLHSVLAQKLQAEKHDIPNRHEIRYSETNLCCIFYLKFVLLFSLMCIYLLFLRQGPALLAQASLEHVAILLQLPRCWDTGVYQHALLS